MTDDDFGNGNNAIDYLVGCSWTTIPSSSSMSPSSLSSLLLSCSPALHLLVGNSISDGYLFQINVDRITPLMHLKGGHRGCIRGFAWVDNTDDVGGCKSLVRGGEDARLCEWEMSSGGDTTHIQIIGTMGSGGRVRSSKNAISDTGSGGWNSEGKDEEEIWFPLLITVNHTVLSTC